MVEVPNATVDLDLYTSLHDYNIMLLSSYEG